MWVKNFVSKELWIRHTKGTKKIGIFFFNRTENKTENFKGDLRVYISLWLTKLYQQLKYL